MLRLTIAIALVLAAPHAVGAPEPSWKSQGPYGGLSFRITVDDAKPDRLLVDTNVGYLLSRDAGATWQRIRRPAGAGTGQVVSLANGYLLTEVRGVVHTSEDGRAWKADGPVPGRALAFAGGPGLWALTVETDRTGKGFLRMMRREDLGWLAVARFPAQVAPRGTPLARIVIRRDRPDVIRAIFTQFDESNVTRVVGSDDGGKTFSTWTFAPRLWDLVPLPGDGLGFAGVALHRRKGPDGPWRTSDGARTWKRATEDARAKSLRSLAADGSGRVLLGTTASGVLETTSTFGALTPRNEGLVNRTGTSLAIHPTNPRRVWAGTQCGLFRSEDAGRTWKAMDEGFEAGQFSGLALGPKGRILAFEFFQGLRRSEDGGATWKPVDLGWKERFGRAFSVVGGGETIAVATGAGKDWRVTVTRDGGETWSMQRFPVSAVPTGVGPKGEVYVSQKGGLLLRSVTGLDFIPFGEKHPKVGEDIHRVLPVADGRHLLLLGGLGAALVKAGSGSGELMIDPPVNEPLLWPVARLDSGDALYVSDRQGNVYRKEIPGGGWEHVLEHRTGLLVGVVTDPAKMDRRIAVFADGRLDLSDDGGRTWRSLQKPGTLRWVDHPVAGPDRRLYLSANGAIRTLDLSGL